MADVASASEVLAHADQLDRQADYDDFRDRSREKVQETAMCRRIAARLRQDYGGASG